MYDLEERTALFGQNVIDLCKKTLHNAINNPLVSQLIRSATSIGANYAEANAGSSKQDFRNKIYICKKETQETRHWLRMLEYANPEQRDLFLPLVKECQELILIFGRIVSTLDGKTDKLRKNV